MRKWLSVIYKFKDDWKINIYHVASKKQAAAMVLQLKSNPNIEYAIIGDDVAL